MRSGIDAVIDSFVAGAVLCDAHRMCRFINPQNGDDNVALYFSSAVDGKTTIMRIDDCEMNIPVIRKLCEEAT